MEIRQLEYFVAVAEEANFTRAAERVHISQSGVSAQIRQLEHDLGATLFDRSGRTARLTAAGEAALQHARTVLSGLAEVRQAVDDVQGLVSGRLLVGMVMACTITPFFDALSDFHRRHPGVDVTLAEDTSDLLIDRVRTGALDLALIGVAGSPPADLEAQLLISESIVAAVPKDHPLAKRRRASLAEVTQHSIVCLPAGTGVRTVLDLECAARGLQPDIALQASAPDAVADLSARGLGVAILSETMAKGYLRMLTPVAISDITTPALLALAWKPAQSPALRELLADCRRAFATLR